MADGFFPTLVSKDANPNAAADPLYVQLTDGTAVLTSTGTSLDVNLTNTSVPVTGTFWQTTQPVSGSVSVTNGAGASAVNIQDGGNSITVDGSVGVSNGAGASAVNIQDGGNSITVDGSVTVTATALDIRTITKATDSIQVSANSSVNSVSNPIFVAMGSGVITGEVHDYLDTTTVNHDYTVTNTMLLKSVECAASGGCKFELRVGPLATLATKWVGFVPKAGGVISAHFDPPIEVPNASTGTVRIIRTNREGVAQDLYSTIVGIDA